MDKILYCFELKTTFIQPAYLPGCCKNCTHTACRQVMQSRYGEQLSLFTEEELSKCGEQHVCFNVV